MTSPFTGGKVTLKYEETTITYRGEVYPCKRYFYVCEDTGIEFTDANIDDRGLFEVHSKYRISHGIPFPKDLAEIRKSIGIPSRTMSLILGLGENQYRLYENGEMPSESIGKMLATLRLPGVIESYLQSSKNLLSEKQFKKAMNAIYRNENTTYGISSDISIVKMSTAKIASSILKCSKSRWSDIEEGVSLDNVGIPAYAL